MRHICCFLFFAHFALTVFVSGCVSASIHTADNMYRTLHCESVCVYSASCKKPTVGSRSHNGRCLCLSCACHSALANEMLLLSLEGLQELLSCSCEWNAIGQAAPLPEINPETNQISNEKNASQFHGCTFAEADAVSVVKLNVKSAANFLM